MKLKHNLYLGRNFSRFKYCDATLTSGGSRSIPVHRVVLASVCTKFETLFDSNYNSSNSLVVEDVDFDILEKVIDFIYSGEIIINDNSKDDLVAEAMEKLQLDLSVVCETFVREEEGDVVVNNNDTAVSDGNRGHCTTMTEFLHPSSIKKQPCEEGEELHCSPRKSAMSSTSLDVSTMPDSSNKNSSCKEGEELHCSSSDPAMSSTSLDISTRPDSSNKNKSCEEGEELHCSSSESTMPSISLGISTRPDDTVFKFYKLRVRTDIFKCPPSSLSTAPASPLTNSAPLSDTKFSQSPTSFPYELPENIDGETGQKKENVEISVPSEIQSYPDENSYNEFLGQDFNLKSTFLSSNEDTTDIYSENNIHVITSRREASPSDKPRDTSTLENQVTAPNSSETHTKTTVAVFPAPAVPKCRYCWPTCYSRCPTLWSSNSASVKPRDSGETSAPEAPLNVSNSSETPKKTTLSCFQKWKPQCRYWPKCSRKDCAYYHPPCKSKLKEPGFSPSAPPPPYKKPRLSRL